MQPGSPAGDAPVSGTAGGWLLDYLGHGFTLLVFVDAAPAASLLRDLAALCADPIACSCLVLGAAETALPAGVRAVAAGSPMLAQRYDDETLDSIIAVRQVIPAVPRIGDLDRARAAHDGQRADQGARLLASAGR